MFSYNIDTFYLQYIELHFEVAIKFFFIYSN